MKNIIIGVASALFGAGVGAKVAQIMMQKKVDEKKALSDKHLSLFKMMNQWVRVKQEGKKLETYFEANNISKIAIYGMNYAGETLVEELKGSKIQIAYGIDKRAKNLFADFPIFSADEPLDKVDAIVVTPITFFDQIEQELRQKIDCNIISLEDILYEL